MYVSPWCRWVESLAHRQVLDTRTRASMNVGPRHLVPPGGLVLLVHSFWSGLSGGCMIPPSQTVLCRDGDAPVELHSYNTTNWETSGLHFDPLFRMCVHAKF